MIWLSCEHEEKNNLVFAGIMADVGISAEEESRPRNPINNEEGNIRDGEIWVNLNESRNDNPCELQKIVKELLEGLKRI